ncbi:DUF6631 family protein [Rhodanobacter sp. UC4450_H17]
MARKVTTKKPVKRPDTGRDDLSISHPDRDIAIAGRAITVHEYDHPRGLQVRAQTRPFLLALEKLFQDSEGLTDDVLAVVGEYREIMNPVIALSAQVELAWVEALGDADSDALLVTWWEVCGPFFLRQLLRRARERMRRQELFAGQTSTSNSPMPVSAPPSSSADTPSASSASSTAA